MDNIIKFPTKPKKDWSVMALIWEVTLEDIGMERILEKAKEFNRGERNDLPRN